MLVRTEIIQLVIYQHTKTGAAIPKTQELTPVEGMKAFAATCKKNYVRTAEVMRIENGQFAEHWDVVDETNMLFALGILTKQNTDD